MFPFLCEEGPGEDGPEWPHEAPTHPSLCPSLVFPSPLPFITVPVHVAVPAPVRVPSLCLCVCVCVPAPVPVQVKTSKVFVRDCSVLPPCAVLLLGAQQVAVNHEVRGGAQV